MTKPSVKPPRPPGSVLAAFRERARAQFLAKLFADTPLLPGDAHAARRRMQHHEDKARQRIANAQRRYVR